LFFDFLPIDGGTVKCFKVRFKLWTVPGQVMYNSTRQLVLRGADGLVFIVDSQWNRLPANLESLKNLEENLEGMERKLSDLAVVAFYNKRDLAESELVPVEALDLLLEVGRRRLPRLAGDCLTGTNVFKALNQVTQKVLQDFLTKDDLENYEAYR
jgi:mutual gliding-motility protein MglA